MKKPFHQRVGDFLEGKGFYIVLFLCVAAIGISGYYLFDTLLRDTPEAPVAATARITVTPTPAPTPAAVSERPAAQTVRPAPAQTPAPEETPPPSAPPAEPEEAALPQTGPAAFVWPVQGQLLTAFSADELFYNPTMGDWRTHGGLDVAAIQGAEVRASAAGTVTSVTQDPLMGTTVTVEHGGGFTTTYANLAPAPAVEAGDSVASGQVLGLVGDTAIAESALGSHLHFAIAVDGTEVDPLDYLPG